MDFERSLLRLRLEIFNFLWVYILTLHIRVAFSHHNFQILIKLNRINQSDETVIFIQGEAIRSENLKLIHNLRTSTFELYDLDNDLSETTNLIQDGRYAKIEFIKDWELDSQRRDFKAQKWLKLIILEIVDVYKSNYSYGFIEYI